MTFIDVHTHVSPFSYPSPPNDGVRSRWPCMHCQGNEHTLFIGDAPFRKLDARSWDTGRRLEDMDRDGIDLQVLSPMPELLSYWLALDEAESICDVSNHQIAEMIAAAPNRFRGLGATMLQNPSVAAQGLRRIKEQFGLSGVEIGSNINGKLLGDPEFDPFWAAAEEEGLAIFVHALHPVASKPLPSNPLFTTLTLFPVDVAMAAASMLMAGVPDRFPGLRIAFSHGGGALSSMLGRLDAGWLQTGGFNGKLANLPSSSAQRFFYDSNVYSPAQLRHLAIELMPGRVFAGTDYPYDIMQKNPGEFIDSAVPAGEMNSHLRSGAACQFLGEEITI